MLFCTFRPIFKSLIDFAYRKSCKRVIKIFAENGEQKGTKKW